MKSDSPSSPHRSRVEIDSAPPPEQSGVAIRGAAIRVIGYLVGLIVSLGSATLLVRSLGISSFGRYVTVTSLVALVGGVTEAGISVYGMREFHTWVEPERQRMLANLLTMRLALTAIGVAAAVCFGLAVGYRSLLVLGVLVAGATLLVQVVVDVLSIPLQARLQLGRLTGIELTRRLLVLLLIGALALAGGGLLPFLAASTVAAAIALALLALMTRPSVVVRLNFDRRAWRKLFADTLPLAITVSIGTVYFYVTVIVMSLVASAYQTGLFSTSFRLTQVALGIPVLLLTAVFPLMSRGGEPQELEPGHRVGRVFTVAVICGVWMTLAMATGAPALIDLIAGRAGRGAVAVLRIQSLVLVASFISNASGLALVSLRRYRAIMVTTAAALALNVALAVGLVSALGARGGAVGDVVTEVAVAVAFTAVLIRVAPDHGIKLSLVPPVALAAALSMVVLLFPIGSIARAIGATVIYFGVLLPMGAIPSEVIAAARRVRASLTLL